MRGRFDTSRSLLASARAIGEEIGLRHGLLETALYSGIVELLAGDPVAAEPHLREAFGGLGQLGIGADAGQAAAYLARSLLLQGRLDEADDLANDGDALAGQNLQTAIAARAAQAEIFAARGDTASALALADEAVRMVADTDIVFDHANALATLARVRAARGDDAGAHRAAASASDLYARKGVTVNMGLPGGDAGSVDESASPVDRSPADSGVAAADARALTTDGVSPIERSLTRASTADRIDAHFAAMYQSMADGRVADYEAAMHPDLVFTDHRPIGFGSSDLAGTHDRNSTLLDLAGAVEPHGLVVHRATPTVRCAQRLTVTTSAAGSVSEVADVLVVVLDPASGLITSVDKFADGDDAAAISLADRIVDERHDLVPPITDAVVAGAYANATARTGQLELFLDWFADDFRAELTNGLVAALDDLRSGRCRPSALGYGTVDRRLVSAFGDRLALLQVRTDGGWVWSVEEIDDAGRLRVLTHFPDLLGAAAHANRRHLDLERDQSNALLVGLRYYDASLRRDAAALDRMMHADFSFTDHRPIGYQRLDRASTLAALSDPDGRSEQVPIVHSVTYADREFSIANFSYVMERGGGDVWDAVPSLLVQRVRDDQVISVDLFEERDLDEAMALVHEVGGVTGSAKLADGHVAELLDGAVVGLDDVRNGLVDPSAIGHGAAARRVVSELDEFSMVLVDTGRSWVWAVEELRDGQVRRITHFGDLADAARTVGARWWDRHGDRSASTPIFQRYNAAVRAFDRDELEQVLHDDFALTDHRAIGYDRLDRSAFLEATSDPTARPGQVRVNHAMLYLDDAASVNRFSFTTDLGDGHLWEATPCLNVMRVRDDRMLAIDLFDGDHVDDAIALASGEADDRVDPETSPEV
jgi:tetratricopeptide (TPR) repeat protein